MSRRVVVAAYAKVNLTLEVLGKREDGYHELASVFATIDLRDNVRVAASHRLDVRVSPPIPVGPHDELATRSVAALASASGRTAVAHIRIAKRIPLASGLGGGSSDAGATLRGLARLWRLNAEVPAPVDGRVIGIAARPGDLVGIAQPLVTLLQSDELWIVATFDRGALERIRAGQRASVHAAGAMFTARIDSIAPADGQALLEFVESAVEPGAVLRPGAPAAVIVDTRGPLVGKPLSGLT